MNNSTGEAVPSKKKKIEDNKKKWTHWHTSSSSSDASKEYTFIQFVELNVFIGYVAFR